MNNRNPRHFTLAEANGLIPELALRFKELQEKRERYARQHDILFMHELLECAETRHAEESLSATNLEEDIQGLEAAIQDLERDVGAIRSLGCIVRSVEQECVDFPGMIEGKEILFCWKSGETRIGFYRAWNENPEIRRPLPSHMAA